MTTRCYRSKIGRLPFAIRNELNERIRDGEQGAGLLEWLNGLKEMKKILRDSRAAAVNAQNLTDWRTTGYSDWLEDQARADAIRLKAETALSLASAASGDVAGVGCKIAAAKILDIMESADTNQVADLSKALVSLRASENDARKTALSEEKNALQKEQLSLNRAKFERDTARLFVKWVADRDAVAIAKDNRLGADEKTDRLGRLMFGDLWEGLGDGR